MKKKIVRSKTFLSIQSTLRSLPKASIAAIFGAVIVYCQSKGYLGNDEAILVSTILVALGISVNIITKQQPK